MGLTQPLPAPTLTAKPTLTCKNIGQRGFGVERKPDGNIRFAEKRSRVWHVVVDAMAGRPSSSRGSPDQGPGPKGCPVPQLAIAPPFLDEFRRLDYSVQSATLSMLHTVMAGDPPQLRAPGDALNEHVRVLRIGPEWSGVLIPTTSDTYCLLTVRPHEEAVSFARRYQSLDVPALELVPSNSGTEHLETVTSPPHDPEERTPALRAPRGQWHFSAHPHQRHLIETRLAGPAQLTGGPGTGKTALILHRAAQLARTAAPVVGTPGARPVLVTTRDQLLTQLMGQWLDDLVEDPELRDRIDVLTVGSLARGIVHAAATTPPEVLDAGALREQWREQAAADGLPHSARFLVDEWEQVILAHDMTDLASYIRAERTGRLTHLAPEHRPPVWEAVHRYTARMSTRRQWAQPQLAAEATRLLRHSGPLYRHVLIDEVHQLHPAHLRLLRAATPVDSDDLFLVGDPRLASVHYGASLRSLGIEVHGRSHRLRQSYRVSQEILDWTAPILGHGCTATGAVSYLPRPRSVLRGPEPVTHAATSRAAEYSAVASRVKSWLEGGILAADIIVAGRNHWVVRNLAKELQAGKMATAPVDASARVEGVRLATLDQLTGVEFRCVALVGMSEPLLPPRAATNAAEGDPAALVQVYAAERALLYTACTRARDALYLSYVGRPSALLPRLGLR